MYAIIASSNEIFRKGVRYTVSHSLPKLLTEEASTDDDLLQKTTQYSPDLVIIDLECEGIDGLELAKFLKEQHSHIKVLTFTVDHQKSKVLPLLELGVEGYLFKDASGQEIAQAVQQIIKGQNYYDQRVVAVMHSRLVNGQDTPAAPSSRLTQREKEILDLVCQQHTNKEIGDILSISRRTVDGHRNRLMKKCNAKNTAGLIYYALEHGLTQRKQHSA